MYKDIIKSKVTSKGNLWTFRQKVLYYYIELDRTKIVII